MGSEGIYYNGSDIPSVAGDTSAAGAMLTNGDVKLVEVAVVDDRAPHRR